MRSLLCWSSRSSQRTKQKEAEASQGTGHSSGSIKYYFFGILCLALGCISFIWTPFHLIKNEVLRMRSTGMPFGWWVVPDVEVLMKVHVFNLTNYQELIDGTETDFRLEEVGPLIYKEDLRHTNVTFNENGTLTYIAHRKLIFLPERNTISLNDTIYVPNIPLLGMASVLSDWPFFVRLGFNLLLNRYKSDPYVKITIYDLLWNNTDPLIEMAYKLAPSIVPVKNVGLLEMIYGEYSDSNTVFYGTEHPRKYFTMDQFNGKKRFGWWTNATCDSVKGATEGVLYHHDIVKSDPLMFFRKALCRITPILFKEEVERYSMTAYNYTLPMSTFDKPKNGDYCYVRPGDKPLPNGLSDVSPCFYDFPITASFPHFYGVDKKALGNLKGQDPDIDRHGSFSTIEPNTGVPLQSVARMQCNLRVKDVKSFNNVSKFSNMFIPLFWVELNQNNIPELMKFALYMLVVVLPKLQCVVSASLVAAGVCIIYFRILKTSKTKMVTEKEKTECLYSSLNTLPRPV